MERYFRIHWVVKEIRGLNSTGGANEHQNYKLNLFEHAIIGFYYYYTEFHNSHQHTWHAFIFLETALVYAVWFKQGTFILCRVFQR